ncbi:MAG: VOC family protein [Pyrinomonadaceae bacterium]
MFKNTHAFSSFSTNNIAAAKEFYGTTLGLEVSDMSIGLSITLAGGGSVFIYPKGEDHTPANFTVLNFKVDDIDDTVDKLAAKGIKFESYDGEMKTDEKGIMRSDDPSHGPSIAWFADPAGNIISVLQEK